MRYTRDFAENYDYSILDESWNGMERVTDEWFLQQGGLLTREDCVDLLLDGKIDLKGLSAILLEMSRKNMSKVTNLAARKMEHLLKLYYSTSNRSKNHWKKEITAFTKQLQSIFCKKNKISSNMDLINNDAKDIEEEAYCRAVHWYEMDIEHDSSLEEGRDILPAQCPWALEDLILKNIDELLEDLD